MAKPLYFWNGTAWENAGPAVPQSPIAYQASAPSTPSTGDLWIDSDQDLDSYQRQLVRYKFNATGGETSVSGVDANGATLSYTPGAEQVYLNGALLVRGSDYVATDGTSITSLAALSSGDVLEVFAYVAFNPANTYTQSQVDGLVAPMGLVWLHTETGSGVASISKDNIFTSTYNNYYVTCTMDTPSADAYFSMRLRASAADISTGYYAGWLDIQAAGATVSRYANNDTRVWANATDSGNSTGYHWNTWIFNPVASARTTYSFSNNGYISTGSQLGACGNGMEVASSARDGIKFYLESGTGNFTMNIFGVKK